MSQDIYIFCPECPDFYFPEFIEAKAQGQPDSTLDRVRGQIRPQSGKRKMFRRMPAPSLADISSLKIEWQFSCPEGHRVVGNLDPALPIGILGGPGSSKSHFLPALVRELLDGSIRNYGYSMRPTMDTAPEMERRIERIFDQLEVLPGTDRGRLDGPFSYRFIAGPQGAEQRSSLMLFDLSGEDLVRLAALAQVAPFVFHAKGILLLLDPVGAIATSQGDVSTKRAIDLHNFVHLIADALEQAYKCDSFDLNIPICAVIPKGDCVKWDGTDLQTLAQPVPADMMFESLRERSEVVRDQLVSLGMSTVIDNLEQRFNPRILRYAAASATSESPVLVEGISSWSEPSPTGCGLALLQLLAVRAM